MTSTQVHDAGDLSIDRLETLMRGRSSLVERLVWRFGGASRVLAVGRRDTLAALLALILSTTVAVVTWGHTPAGTPLLDLTTAWFCALRVVALLWPVRAVYDRYAVEQGLDAAVLAFWISTDNPAHAALAWVVASAVAELLRCHVLTVGAVNIGISSVAALVAAGTFTAVTHAAHGLDASLLACVAATGCYLVTDHLLTLGVVRAMGERLEVRRLLDPTTWLGLTASAALAGLGWTLAAAGAGTVVAGATVSVAMCLTIVFTSLITAIANDRARLRHIVTFLHRMPTFPDEATAVRELELTARQLVPIHDVDVRPWPPAPARREIGFALDGALSHQATEGDTGRWLVARVRDLAPSFHPAEEGALETLALVAGNGLALRRAADETHWLATHDTLTRLANRAELLDRMSAAETRHATAEATSAVVLIDIDGFKAVNDTISHEAGDHVLAVLGPRIGATIEAAFPDAVPARLGGDEFAAFLPEVVSAATVEAACEGALRRIREPIEWQGRTLRLDASIGYSIGPQILSTSLLREADAAMYLVKHNGKGGIGRYVVSPDA